VDHARNHQPVAELDERTEAGASLDVLDMVLRRDEARRVWQVVARLPQSQQVVMRLRFLDDLSLGEIAAIMGRSEAAVKLLVHRAVLRLRTELIERRIEPRYQSPTRRVMTAR
jgi:RNA polymerase sigma-70 factor (ECF subfamily)